MQSPNCTAPWVEDSLFWNVNCQVTRKTLVSFMGTGSTERGVGQDSLGGCLSSSRTRCPLQNIVDHCGWIRQILTLSDKPASGDF